MNLDFLDKAVLIWFSILFVCSIFQENQMDSDAKSLGVRDPLEDAPDASGSKSQAKKDTNEEAAVHIRVQQRNGRKSLTTVQGLPQKLDKKKILKALKKDFCCNGTVVEDNELGSVLQLQGDQRKNVSQFLVEVRLR